MIKKFEFCTARVKKFENHQGIHPDDDRGKNLWGQKIAGSLEEGLLLSCKGNPNVVYIVKQEDRSIIWYTTRLESLVAHKKHLKAFVRVGVLDYKNKIKK